MASSDKVLIVASSSRMFDLWPLKKCWFDFFRKTCGYPSDIHLYALQVLFWGPIGIKRYVLYNSM